MDYEFELDFDAERGMNVKMNSLHDLFVHELQDIYCAEKKLAKALPKMIKAASHDELREALENHLQESEQQLERVEGILRELAAPTRGAKCPAMEGLIEEGEIAIEQAGADEVRDAAIICAVQRLEHYEMAAYGCARTFAEELGHVEIARALEQSHAPLAQLYRVNA